MKKVLFSLFTMLVLSTSLHAQFIEQMILLSPHYYPGEVLFKDGHTEEFAELELPRAGRSQLGVKRNVGDKKRESIDVADIVAIRIWHKNFPDKPHTLFYVHARKRASNHEHIWGYPIAGSAWGTVYQCEVYYQMNKKTGDIDVVKFKDQRTHYTTPTRYYLFRDGWDFAELVMGPDPVSRDSRKRIAKLFEEKPEIAEAIRNGDLGGEDMQFILDEMAGGKKVEEPKQPATTIPEVKTDSTSNGVVGDDE